MTDRDILMNYRLKQAEETLQEAKKMLDSDFSPRTIINRAYYSMFYAVLALFLKTGQNIKTSKHKGVISLFDKEFIKSGKIDKHFSEIFHNTFNARLECDYKELVEMSLDDAVSCVTQATDFVNAAKTLIEGR